nr:sphingomyelin phosphodiesterase 1 [Quercus suber]
MLKRAEGRPVTIARMVVVEVVTSTSDQAKVEARVRQRGNDTVRSGWGRSPEDFLDRLRSSTGATGPNSRVSISTGGSDLRLQTSSGGGVGGNMDGDSIQASPSIVAQSSTASIALVNSTAPANTTDPTILGKEIIDAFIAGGCAGCQGVVTVLKSISLLGDDVLAASLTYVCIAIGAEDPDVCKGTLDREGPILAANLRRIIPGSRTSVTICANVLGLCPYPATRKSKLRIPAPKVKRTRPCPSGKRPIHVVHISDTHVDESYTPGANYDCTKPICCRPYTPADAPGNTSTPCGPFGDVHCDPPLVLEKNMISAINKQVNPAFTIFTGDVPAHDIWLVDRPEVEHNFETTFTEFAKLKRALYPSVGNHDTAPVNAFPAKSEYNFAAVNPQWTYNKLSSLWQTWIGGTAEEVKDYGTYSYLRPGTNHRIIAYNSIFYYTTNFWMYSEPMPEDPSHQFAWLINELQCAETKGERVWLIAHIPPGSGDFLREYSSYFNDIVQRYSGTIAATFHGHTHIDQFEIAYANYSNPTAHNAKMVAYIAPSMTPTSGSPAFRSYSVDPVTFNILDFTEYIANISAPQFQQTPVWTKYYSAKAAYGSLLSPPITDPAAELSPAFWHNVTKVFEANDTAFQQYYIRQSRGYKNATCTGTCKTQQICGLRAFDAEYNCHEPVPGFNFKRDVATRAPELHDECGEAGTKIRSLFWGLTRKHQLGEL